MHYLVITANAAIDTTYVLDVFRSGTLNRARQVIAAPGGKGNNVGRVLASLGHRVTATGIVGGSSGRFIEETLRAQGIDTAFVMAPGESRRCLTFIEQESGTVSEVLEPGIEVPAEVAERLAAQVGDLAQNIDMAVISGSLPPGLPADYYARLIDSLHTADVPVALDSSGEALHCGLRAQPALIKPNQAELCELLGEGQELRASPTTIIERAREQVIGRILGEDATILLSLGGEGAALITADQVVRAIPPQVSVVNPVGAGDAMLAGFLDGKARRLDDAAALRLAVATGTAATLELTAGVVDVSTVERLLLAVHTCPQAAEGTNERTGTRR